MYTTAVVNSAGYNFYIHWSNNMFAVSGRHGFHDEDEILGILSTAEEVAAHLKTYINTWCSIFIIQYETMMVESCLLCHQVFRAVGDIGDKGTSLMDSIELLQKMADSFDKVVIMYCLLKHNIIL